MFFQPSTRVQRCGLKMRTSFLDVSMSSTSSNTAALQSPSLFKCWNFKTLTCSNLAGSQILRCGKALSSFKFLKYRAPKFRNLLFSILKHFASSESFPCGRPQGAYAYGALPGPGSAESAAQSPSLLGDGDSFYQYRP